MSAVISDCGLYRYKLTRTVPNVAGTKCALFIMLNPSTATAEVDDPTIRRCLGFARRENCARLTVVNLFALRATNPRDLRLHSDPEGMDNDVYLFDEVYLHRSIPSIIVAAWGNDAFARRRAEYVLNHTGPVLCLGKTKSGAPKHPLYLSKDAPLISLI